MAAVLPVIVGAAVVALGPQAAAEPTTVQPPCVEAAADAVTASAVASACGQPVEVLNARTEYSQTFANPDGTATLEQSVVPQRVRRGDGWVPVDTSLRVTPEGIAPVATVLPMTFSPGGRGPLARLISGAHELALTWDGVLPAPSLSANTALYRNVLPGVDLRVTAEPTGFSEVLVVRSRSAAANPRLANLHFGLTTKGVTVAKAEGGGLVATDAQGRRIFTSPAPMMWDSGEEMVAPTPKGVTRSAADEGGPGQAVRRAVMPVRVEAAKLVLTPDQSILNDPSTKFPVYIDPSWTGGIAGNAWTMVWSKYPNSSFWRNSTALNNGSTKGDVGAGRTRDCDTCAQYIIRTMYHMDLSGVAGKHIISAQFRIDQKWAWTCSPASDAELWVTSGISPSTTWNNQPSWNSSLRSRTPANHKLGAVHGCQGPATIEFNTTEMVSWAVGTGASFIAVGLRAINEGTLYQWKRFAHASATMAITYNTSPDVPAERQSDGQPCPTGQDVAYVTTLTPTLSVQQSDPDEDQQSLTTWFHWWPAGGARNDTDRVSRSGGNPATVSAAIPAGQLTDGGSYLWQAYTTDGTHNGEWTAECAFTVDASPPETPGGVASTDYPSDGTPHGGVGLPGLFTISPPTVRPEEVVAYAYTLNGDIPAAEAPIVAAGTGFGASLTLAPARDGVNTLRVWSMDRAGRFSTTPATYTFSVRAGAGPAAEWTFDEASGAATDTTGHGNPATLSGGVTRTPGRGGVPNALTLDGSTGYAATAGPVLWPHPDTGIDVPVRTDTSFTVSARVLLPATGGTGTPTAVSADGNRTSAFALGYSASNNRWSFAMASADVDAPTISTVYSDAAPTPGQWTHLAGVYDSATGQLRLYVNGAVQASVVTLSGGFNATGPVTIGRKKWAGSASDYFAGSIDDVRLYSFAETEPKLAALAAPLAPVVTFPDGDEATAGGTLRVRFDAMGDTNVTSFHYSAFHLDLDLTAIPDTPGGAVTVTIDVGATTGVFPLMAASRAGNLDSAVTAAMFSVSAAASISGVVYDLWTFEPLDGAVVTVSPDGGQAVTGPDGAYEIAGFPPGLYTVTAQINGPCGPSTSIETDIDTGGAWVDLFVDTTAVPDPCG